MDYFPICVNINKKRCVVIGGGMVAERKVGGLLDSGATVTVISPEVTDNLKRLIDSGKVAWTRRGYASGDLAGAFLVIAATDDQEVQSRVFAEAEAANQLINVADVPERCNFILPATMRRGDLAISVSTGGKSPALAGKVKKKLDACFGLEYGVLVDILGMLRPQVLARGLGHKENKKLFKQIVAADMADWIRQGDWATLEQHLVKVLGPETDLSGLEGYKDKLA